MITGTVWGLTLIAVGLVATFAATQVFAAALFPARFARMRSALRGRPKTATAGGLVALTLAVFVAMAIGKSFQLGAAVLGVGSVFVAIVGTGAVAAEIGERMPSAGAAAPPWRALVRGSIVCSLVSLLPLAGWFAIFPLLLGAGFGAWLLSFFVRDAAPAREAPEARSSSTRVEEDELVASGT